MLTQSYKDFLSGASVVPDFVPGTKDEHNDISQLADLYLKAEQDNNKELMDGCVCALMVRFWYLVPKIYSESRSMRLEMTDFINWLYEAVAKALKYRGWTKEGSKINAEQAINRCLFSVRNHYYQHANLDKKKINYLTYSLNAELNEDSVPLIDVVEDKSAETAISTQNHLMDYFLSNNKLLEAFIVDGIINSDCFGVKDNKSFNLSKLITYINNMDTDYFSETYCVDKDMVCSEKLKLNSLSKDKMRASVTKALSKMRDNKKVLGELC